MKKFWMMLALAGMFSATVVSCGEKKEGEEEKTEAEAPAEESTEATEEAAAPAEETAPAADSTTAPAEEAAH